MNRIGLATARLSLAIALLLSTSAAVQALDPTHDKILYAVGYGHLDDQWNWTIQDTINLFIPASLHQNFPYFTNASFSNYTFSFEGALRYQWIKEYYPADFLTLSNYIRTARWHVAGSMLTPSDVNIPSPEALIRHVLYANTYWNRTFLRAPTDLLLPDAFGFGYALPTVAAHCGVKGFSSMRAGPGTGISIPFQNIGRWLGPDGAAIIAVVNPGAYSQPVTDNLANDSYHYQRITNTYAESGLYLDYMYFGNSGDQGGGPSVSSVSNVCLSVQTTNGLVNVLSASSDQLYNDLTPAQVAQLRPYQGELVAQTLGTGGYTSHAELKKFNRQCEQQAAAAESAAVVADWLQGGTTYPSERIQQAWQRFLWHDMYDDITGVSIPAAYTFTWNDYLLSLNDFAAVESSGVGTLAQALDTTATGVPLIVFNPLSVARQDLVEAAVTFASGVPPAIRVFDPQGNEVPSQTGPASSNTLPVIFLANVPATGVAVYDVRSAASPSALNTGLSVGASQVQNGRYLVKLNASGDVTSILDKANNQQLLSAPVRWDFLYDLSTSLPSWEIQYNNISTAPTSYLTGPPIIQILENGPARVTLAVTRYNAGSTITERIRLAAGQAGDRVEWDVSAHWHTPQTLLKMEFPLAISNPYATFDLGMGTIQRPNATSKLYEVPAQQWADLSGTYGVTIMSDCKYGWDKPANNTLRLTVFHTPAVSGSFPYQASDSFGTHRMLVGVMGHTNDWRGAGTSWTAARLNQPLQAFQTTSHGPISGSFSNTFSFLSCNNSNVMVKALKKAEGGGEIVVRLQELSGQPQTVQLTFASPIVTARRITGTEGPITSLFPSNGTLTVSLGAYAPVSLALTLTSPSSLLPAPASMAVSLPFNLDVISTDGNRTNGNFDAGFTYPAELMPPSIVRDGVTFQLGPTNDGAYNALACQGQTIPLNASGYDHLCFLAAAASATTIGQFSLASQVTNFVIPYFTGFFGQFNPPARMTNQEVAWVCTHRHDGSGNNNAYNFCYLYLFRIDLPPTANSLTLPNNPNIRLFSMTLVSNAVSGALPTGGPIAQNLPPWANAGPAQMVNAPGSNSNAMVTLDGSGSVDPDGGIVSYRWSMNGASLATGVTAVVSLPIGTNRIALTVTDNQGEIAIDETTVVVLPPLTVALSGTPTNSSSAPLTVQFTGQASEGPPTSAPFDTTDDHLGTISAQGENNGLNGNWEVATNAFDDSISTKWLDFATNFPSTRSSWIQYLYPDGFQHVVTNYTITSANDAPERDPASWALLGSNDGGSTWSVLDVQTNQVFSSRFQTQTYTVGTPGAYNLYRLRIDKVANPTTAVAVQLAEIQLLGAPVYTYLWSFGDGGTAVSAKADSADIQQHTYTNNGTYTIVLGAAYGIYTGTNSMRVTVGPPLTSMPSGAPEHGGAPLTVQFNGQLSGGRTNSGPIDTTDDHLGIVTAQGENNGLNGNSEVASNAFDDTTGTKWLDFADNYPDTRQSWIQYQYPWGLMYSVWRYTVTSANDATIYPERNPANWHFLGSNDGGQSWTTLDIQTNQVFTANFQKKFYTISNPMAYDVYRFQIDRVANPSVAVAMQLDELEFIATLPAFWWSFGDGTYSVLQNPQHTYTSNGTYTVVLVVADGVSSATNSMSIYVAPPPLSVSGPSSGAVRLSWPMWASNYTVYSATNLETPIMWAPVTNAVGSSGANFFITVPLDVQAKRFFRLAR